MTPRAGAHVVRIQGPQICGFQRALQQHSSTVVSI